ncbi:MAG: protein kinase [Planctomycetota bacterium]
MDTSSRLTAALALFLACRERGDDPRQLADLHPDLADLLAPMCDEGAGEADDERRLGDYRLLREVGRGGMGVVFEAKQVRLDRRVALKVLAPEVSGNPTSIARFRREARTLAKLDHPHVVRVLEVGETDGQHWLAMDYVDGETLDDRIGRLQTQGGHSRTSRRQLVETIADIAEALQHVHDAGILHRDVKPSNILIAGRQRSSAIEPALQRMDPSSTAERWLDKKGRALLSDFGLAREAEAPAMTQVGTVAGTPHYMSPEHLAGGQALTPASDVFSLGATLYECVVLRRPFDGDSTPEVLHEIAVRDPADPRRVDGSVPRDLAAILLKALEKDPARRYPTAGAFADDLRAFLEMRPVTAEPPSVARRLRRWARREPLQATLASVLLVLVGLAGFLAIQWPSMREAERAHREQEYEDAITRGDMARLAGDRDASLAACARARALFPERAEALVWQCLALSEFEGPERALRELEAVYGHEARDDVVENLRAYLLTTLGRSDDAAAATRRAGTPTTPTGMLFAATTLLLRGKPGDLERAGQLMSLAVRMSRQPRLFLYACWAGVAPPEQRGECADAILALWPSNPLALQQAALCLAPTDPARAVPLMRRAIDTGIKSNNPHQLLAAMAWRAGERDTAVKAAREALALDQLDDELRTNLIDKLLRPADPAAAADELAAWLARDPANAAALRLRARELDAQGDAEGALAHLERALSARPDDPDLQCMRCDLLQRTGSSDHALAEAERLVAAHPEHAAAHQTLTLLSQAAGRSDKVVTELRRWTKQKPDDPNAWVALATALRQQPDDAQRREALEAVAAADYLTGGKSAKILALRAELHDDLGEAAAAALCRSRAAEFTPATK